VSSDQFAFGGETMVGDPIPLERDTCDTCNRSAGGLTPTPIPTTPEEPEMDAEPDDADAEECAAAEPDTADPVSTSSPGIGAAVQTRAL